MSLEIQDLGSKRVVTVDNEQWNGQKYCKCRLDVDTVLPVDVIKKLAEYLNESWFVSSIRRLEHPKYLSGSLMSVMEEFPPSSAKGKFLDFGCGIGSSTFAIARLGYPVVGVELIRDALKMGRMLSEAYGVTDSVKFVETEKTYELPFQDCEFDAVMASGVFEHIKPEERKKHLLECWRVLKPGGVFYVVDSPNRAWPLEAHTTGLPFVHWLPLKLGCMLAKRFSKRAIKNYSADELVEHGIRGVNLFSLLRVLPGSEMCISKKGNTEFYFTGLYDYKRGGRFRRAIYTSVYIWFKLLEKPLRLIHVPVEGFYPFFDLAIRKKSDV